MTCLLLVAQNVEVFYSGLTNGDLRRKPEPSPPQDQGLWDGEGL